MNKFNQLLVIASILLFSACGKETLDVADQKSVKKNVEVKITFGSNHDSYGANFGLQVASVDGGLNSNFRFDGITSTPSIIHDASIIHQAEISPISSPIQSIKTSMPISTFSIATTATNLEENVAPLTVKYEFYIDGKKAVEKSLSFQAKNYAAKVLIIDVSNPSDLIEN